MRWSYRGWKGCETVVIRMERSRKHGSKKPMFCAEWKKDSGWGIQGPLKWGLACGSNLSFLPTQHLPGPSPAHRQGSYFHALCYKFPTWKWSSPSQLIQSLHSSGLMNTNSFLPFSFPSSSTMKAVHREALHLAPTYCKCPWQIIPTRVPCGGTFPGTGEKITERRKPLLSQSLQSPGPDESALLVSSVFYPSTQVIPDCLEQSVLRTIQLSVSTTCACRVVLVVVGVLLVVIWIECHREPVFMFYFILSYFIENLF